jgi:hypothetical protein
MTKIEEINDALASVTELITSSLIFNTDDLCYDLELSLADRKNAEIRCVVRFHDVGELRMVLGLGGIDQLHSLGFWDAPRTWFDRPLIVSQLEYDNLSFSCKSATLLERPKKS